MCQRDGVTISPCTVPAFVPNICSNVCFPFDHHGNGRSEIVLLASCTNGTDTHATLPALTMPKACHRPGVDFMHFQPVHKSHKTTSTRQNIHLLRDCERLNSLSTGTSFALNWHAYHWCGWLLQKETTNMNTIWDYMVGCV